MIVVPRIQKISLSLEFFIVIIVIVTSAINRATFMISREVNASLCAVPRLVQGSTDELISLAVLSLTARSTITMNSAETSHLEYEVGSL